MQRLGLRGYVALISSASVAVTLGVQAVSPGLPVIQDALGLTNGQIGWFTTVYVLPGVLLTIPMGILGDTMGRRLLFGSALVVYGAAALIQVIAAEYAVLLAMRALQGACFAAVMPLTITVIGDAFKGRQRVSALAGRSAILTGSEVFLPLTGAFLAGLSWAAPLLVQTITIPLGLLSVAIVRNSADSVVTRGYASTLVRVLREQPGMFAVLLTGFARFFFKFGLLAYLPILLVNERAASVTKVGVVISIGSLVAAITATRMPLVMRSIAPSLSVIIGVIAIGISMAAFAGVPDWRWALAAGVIYGVGDGVISVLQDTYAIHTAQAQIRSAMVSVSQTARNLGKFCGPLLMTAIVALSSVEVAFATMALMAGMMLPMFLPLRSMDGGLQESIAVEPFPDGSRTDSREVSYE